MRPAAHFQPTPEQTAVLGHDLQPSEVLLLNAYAGAGKSTTLRLLAEAHPRRRFFYVCFNRSVALAARAVFPANAFCETLHKVARDAVARDYPRDKLGVELKPLEIAELLKLRERYLAYWIKRTLQEFLHSADDHPSGKHTHALSLSPGQESMIVDLTERLWSQMKDPGSSVPLPHDGYLKLYVMGGYPLRSCDVVLLDEAQDTNPVTTLFLRRQRREQRAIVLVGDRHQAIYGFRGAFNFMEQADKAKDCTRLSLTSSFRFGQPIADLASDLLNAFKGDPVRLRGLGQPQRTKARAFIARTNAGLLEEAENLISAGLSRLHFVGTSERQGYNPAVAYGFSDLLDVYHLRKKDPGQVKSSYFRRFDSYEQLRELASDHRARDLELSRLVSFVDRWRDEVPDLLNRFANASVSPEAAQATLATAHRAKGLEWDTVRMADDFLDLTEAPRPQRDLNEQAFAEEINLLYVAITRSRSQVEVPEHLQRWHHAWCRRAKPGELKNGRRPWGF